MKRPDWLKLSPSVVFGLVAVGVLGLGGVVIYLPQLQTASLRQGVEDYRSLSPKPDPEKLATLEKGRIDSENAIRTGLIQGIGGTVLLVGLYFTYQNLRATQRNVAIAEDKQVAERFSKAVEMLSSVSLHTRLGGIYALERIARDSDNDYGQVMEVLTAFVREESPWPPKIEKTESEGATVELKGADPVALPQPVAEESEAVVEASQIVVPQPKLSEQEQRQQAWEQGLKERKERFAKLLLPLRTDIQAVMAVIGRRQPRTAQAKEQKLDLRQTDLRQLRAQGFPLVGVILWRAHLGNANLKEAHLENASLSRAHLEFATLTEAHLENADLRGVDLSQVLDLTHAQLDSALTSKYTILPDYLLAAQLPPQEPIASPSPATPEPNSEPQPPQTEP